MRLTMTAGVTASSAHMSRAFGSDWSCSSLKFCCVRVVDVSMTGDDPVTAVENAARAGAAAVVLYGTAIPAGGLGLDESVPVPVVATGMHALFSGVWWGVHAVLCGSVGACDGDGGVAV